MNIFISWSGDASREIAQELKDWIPIVIQSAKPYYTPKDIEPGQRWDAEISKNLRECEIGLICLTKDNREKPWILFEAGALSNRLEQSRVCPILFGLEKVEVKGPLSGIQLTPFRKTEFFALIQTINNISEVSLSDTVLTKTFETFYPDLEQKINEILEKYEAETKNAPSQPIRDDRDILEEILELVRKQNISNTNESALINNLYKRSRPNLLTPLPFNNSVDKSKMTFSRGDRVFHKEFGYGQVTDIIDNGKVDYDILIISFDENPEVSYHMRLDTPGLEFIK